MDRIVGVSRSAADRRAVGGRRAVCSRAVAAPRAGPRIAFAWLTVATSARSRAAAAPRAGSRIAFALLTAALAAASGCAARAKASARVLSRGSLAYAVDAALVATAADQKVSAPRSTLLASVELSDAFFLVLRRLDGSAAPDAPQVVPVGPPDWDFVDLDVAPGGDVLAVAALDATVRLHDLPSGRRRIAWRLDAPATAVAFAQGGAWLATGAASGVLCLRRVVDGALLQCVAAHSDRVASLASCGDLLASAGWDGTVRVFRLPSLARVAAWQRRGAANAVAFSPDCARLAVARSAAAPRRPPARPDPGARVELMSFRGAAPVLLRGHAAPPVAVAFAPDGTRILTAGWDGTARLYDAASGRELRKWNGFASLVRDIAVLPDGRRAVIAAWAGRDPDAPSLVVVELPPTCPTLGPR